VSDEASIFLFGALAMACLAIAIKFLKYWRLSRDRFFVWFLASFTAFSIGWCLRLIVPRVSEQNYLAYLPRLFGYLLILIAILDKNRRTED
jgi:hypothetical protein